MTDHIRIEHELGAAPAGNPLVRHPDNISASTWKRVTVAWIRSGQPRPYADSVYEAEICLEGGSRSTVKGFDLPHATRLNEANVRKLAKLMVRDFVEDDDKEASWAAGRLQELKIVEQGEGYTIWRVRIVEPYTD